MQFPEETEQVRQEGLHAIQELKVALKNPLLQVQLFVTFMFTLSMQEVQPLLLIQVRQFIDGQGRQSYA